MAFDLLKLLTDVFDPQAGEVVAVACDLPAALGDDTAAWQERRAMAAEWQRGFWRWDGAAASRRARC